VLVLLVVVVVLVLVAHGRSVVSDGSERAGRGLGLSDCCRHTSRAFAALCCKYQRDKRGTDARASV